MARQLDCSPPAKAARLALFGLLHCRTRRFPPLASLHPLLPLHLPPLGHRRRLPPPPPLIAPADAATAALIDSLSSRAPPAALPAAVSSRVRVSAAAAATMPTAVSRLLARPATVTALHLASLVCHYDTNRSAVRSSSLSARSRQDALPARPQLMAPRNRRPPHLLQQTHHALPLAASPSRGRAPAGGATSHPAPLYATAPASAPHAIPSPRPHPASLPPCAIPSGRCARGIAIRRLRVFAWYSSSTCHWVCTAAPHCPHFRLRPRPAPCAALLRPRRLRPPYPRAQRRGTFRPSAGARSFKRRHQPSPRRGAQLSADYIAGRLSK